MSFISFLFATTRTPCARLSLSVRYKVYFKSRGERKTYGGTHHRRSGTAGRHSLISYTLLRKRRALTGTSPDQWSPPLRFQCVQATGRHPDGATGGLYGVRDADLVQRLYGRDTCFSAVAGTCSSETGRNRCLDSPRSSNEA